MERLQEEKAGDAKEIEKVEEFRVGKGTGAVEIGEEFRVEKKVQESKQEEKSSPEIEEDLEEFEEFEP